MNALVIAANKAATEIESFAAENGMGYMACQSAYGVEVEALAGDEWVRVRDLEDDAEVDAVRFFDCDGTVGNECSSIEEVDAEKETWMIAPEMTDE